MAGVILPEWLLRLPSSDQTAISGILHAIYPVSTGLDLLSPLHRIIYRQLLLLNIETDTEVDATIHSKSRHVLLRTLYSANPFMVFGHTRSIIVGKVFLGSMTYMEQRYIQQLDAVSSIQALTALDKLFRNKNIKYILGTASEVDIMELIVSILSIISYAMQADRLDIIEDFESKRLKLKALLFQHLKFILEQAPWASFIWNGLHDMDRSSQWDQMWMDSFFPAKFSFRGLEGHKLCDLTTTVWKKISLSLESMTYTWPAIYPFVWRELISFQYMHASSANIEALYCI